MPFAFLSRILIVLILTTAVLRLHPQSIVHSEKAILSGTVEDQSGAAIPGSNIELEAPNGSNSHTTTDRNGHFVMGVPPGDYMMTVSVMGFFPNEESIHLSEAISIKKNVTLKVGGCTECVTVVGVRPPLELLDASLTSTLPLSSLPPLNLRSRNSHRFRR